MAVPLSRAEKLIATSRLVLAAACLAAIYLDPLEGSRNTRLTYGLLAAYVVYAAGVMVWTLVASRHFTTWKLVSHSIDVVVFGVINYVAAGPASPFFVFFVFAIICSTLRFNQRVTILTAVITIAIFILSPTVGVLVGHPVEFEMNRYLIRLVHLTVAATLLIYLASYQQRIQRELSRIATWPRSSWRGRDEMVSDLLQRASDITRAGRVLLVFRQQEERVCYLAAASGRQFSCEQEDCEDFEPLFEEIEQPAGPAGEPMSPHSSVHRRPTVDPRNGDHSIPRAVADRLEINSALECAVAGEFVNGRLFFLDRPQESLQEDVAIARIIATLIATRLDYYYAMQQLQKGAVAEERVRVGRDLHDSVLQSLTGVALQLKTIPRLMLRDAEAATRRLDEIQQIIAADQRELRCFIDELHPQKAAQAAASLENLDVRLSDLARRFQMQWSLEIDYHLDPRVHLLTPLLRYEVHSIVCETVANAAKHSGATTVAVNIGVERSGLFIIVSDNGHGFSFHGLFDLSTLNALRQGPVTLKERVASLHGALFLDSTPQGSRIEIRLPIDGGASIPLEL